jgi:carboxyl-terminal processing protease
MPSAKYLTHTPATSPADSDRFKQDMYKALEGIGAVLREDGNYIKVVEIVLRICF